MGFDSIIYTTGIVEASAKPKEYHLLEQHYEIFGKDISVLKRGFRGSFIDYEDERLNEIAKGYVMQAVCYHFITIHSVKIGATDFIMPASKRSLSTLSLDRGMSSVNRILGFWKGDVKNERGYR